MKKILPLFSYIFHPVLIPLFGTAFYIWLGAPFLTLGQQLLLFLEVFIITFLLPLAFLLFLKTSGKVDSLIISDIKQRKTPLLAHILLLLLLIRKSITADAFPPLSFFLLGGILSTLLAFFLLFAKIKTSIHTIGISALTVFIIGLSIKSQINTVNVIAFFIVINGLVATSRLLMKAHTVRELWIGFGCGIVPQIALLYFWL